MSFRLRIAILSSLLAGLALGAFGAGALWLIRDIKIGHIDEEVRSAAAREVSHKHPSSGWHWLEGRLARSFGMRDEKFLLLLVKNADADFAYRSAHWPVDMDESRFEWPVPQEPSVQQDRPPESTAPDAATPGRIANESGEAHREGNPASLDGQELPPTFVPPESDMPDAGFPLPPQTGGNFQGPPPRSSPPVVKLVFMNGGGDVWRAGLAVTPREKVAVAVNLATLDTDMASIRNAFLIAMPFALVMIGLGAWMLSSRAMRPIRRLTLTTQKITAADLDQRIVMHGEDREFAELIEVFNNMLERLQKSFNQASRFSADAAHELKTPLAIIQGQIERAMNSEDAGSRIQGELSNILSEVQRLSTISRKLLLLSKADAGSLRLHREPFDLSAALNEIAEDAHMLAPYLKVFPEIQPGITISADGNLLRQVLHNLISNAIKYNIAGGWIRISTASYPQYVEILVTNSSTGIPDSSRKKIFERFYRDEPSHSRNVEGVGLGLSVSLEIARAHGGNLVLKKGAENEAVFSLTLPLRV